MPAAVRRAYLDNPVAQRAVRLVAEGIGGAPLLPADPKLAALVNATSAGQSLLETLASHLLLHGNGFVQIMKDASGRPVELFALRPERMQRGRRGRRLAQRLRLQSRREGADDPAARRGRLAQADPHPAFPPRRRPLRRGLPRRRGPGGADPQRRDATGTGRCWRTRRGPRARWSTTPAMPRR